MAELLLASGHTVLVDDADLATVTTGGRWYLRRDGRSLYASRKMRREGKVREVTLHGFLTGWPRVDHINGNGLDNRRCNLRPATGSQNQANRHAPPYGSSKYRGVTWHKGARKWQALFRFEGRNRYLGLFVDEAEAARAFDRAAIEAWGDYARVNFPSAGTS